MTYQRQKPLSLAQQYAALRSDWPEGNLRLDKQGLTWTGLLRPTPLSRHYPVRLTYTLPSKPPRMRVLGGLLKDLAPGRRIPHLYSQQAEELCLYTPWLDEWQPHLRLSRTLLPWALLWLLYFEDWLVTDDWQGGGTHPGQPHTFSKTILARLL